MNIFKRIVLLASSVLIFSATASFAATYDSKDGRLTSTDADKVGVANDANMYTVLVVKADGLDDLADLLGSQILYVDQGSTFETFTNMGVKGSALDEGTYAMYIGSDAMENPTVEYFYVKDLNGEEAIDPSIGIGAKSIVINSETSNNDYYYIADISNYSSSLTYGMKFSYVSADGNLYEMYTKLPDEVSANLEALNEQVEGEATIGFGVGITNVPTEYKGSFTAIPYIMEVDANE